MRLDPDLAFRLANGSTLFGWLALACSPGGARWSPLVLVLLLTFMRGFIGLLSLAMLKPREALS